MTTVTIERLAHGGAGVARLGDGRVVFVQGTCPGESVSIDIVQEHARWARGEVIEIESPSDARVAPPCHYFGRCGGCQWQHVDYSLQLASKRQIVVDALERIGGIVADGLVGECVPSPAEYGYRNKIELSAFMSARGLSLGYHRLASDEVVKIDSCHLLPSHVRSIPKALNGSLRYLAGKTDLDLKRVSVRAAAHRSDIEIALVTEPGPFPRKLASSMLASAARATSIVRVLSRGDAESPDVRGVETLSGKGYWHERIAGHEFRVSAPSFFQVNSPAAESLVRIVLEMLAPRPHDVVADLYAGVGTFTLPLAALSDSVVAVESASSAVKDLRRNLEGAGEWADVIGGDAAREIDEIGGVDLALIDPPRAGAEERVLASLAAAAPRALAYVSCEPSTLARDARRLLDLGYRLASATPIDLFPQTYHVETAALFEPA